MAMVGLDEGARVPECDVPKFQTAALRAFRGNNRPMAAKLIPDDLMARMAALDRRCDFSLHRRSEYPHAGAGGRVVWTPMPPEASAQPAEARRVWYVRISLNGGEIRDMVHVTELELAEALSKAVAEAEQRGWHMPG